MTTTPSTDPRYAKVIEVSRRVRWEIEQLIALDALPRTLFLLPPDDGTQEISEMIAGGRWMLNELGIRVPEPDSRGIWFQGALCGDPVRVIPFDALWDGTLPQLFEPS